MRGCCASSHGSIVLGFGSLLPASRASQLIDLVRLLAGNCRYQPITAPLYLSFFSTGSPLGTCLPFTPPFEGWSVRKNPVRSTASALPRILSALNEAIIR